MKSTSENNVLSKRLLLSLGILSFIRLGAFLPVPGIDHEYLAFYVQSHSLTRTVVSNFAGNNSFVIGIFTLNIFPYINASILIQLLTSIFPKLSRLQKEGSSESKRTINKLTRLITLGFAFIQSASITVYLKRALFNWSPILAFEIIIWLTTGAMIVLWLSEFITEYGLGNGASLLIYINIISNIPGLVKNVVNENSENLNFRTLVIIGSLLFLAISGIVLLQEGARIVPLISAKQLLQISPNFPGLPETNYIPLRFNQAGVMPIVLTTAVLVIPNYISSLGLLPILTVPLILKYSKIIYWISSFILILLFSSFYSTIVLNPKDISDELQKAAVSIPGIRPGLETTFYLKQVMKRVTLIGGVILAILASLPTIIEAILPISNLNGFGTTSLLILVGVVLDISREMRNIVISNIYK